MISAYVQEEAVLTGGGGRVWQVGGVGHSPPQRDKTPGGCLKSQIV